MTFSPEQTGAAGAVAVVQHLEGLGRLVGVILDLGVPNLYTIHPVRSAPACSEGRATFARVLSNTGRWIVLHGATLVSDRSPRVAVIVEPAHPARIVPLLMAAYQ